MKKYFKARGLKENYDPQNKHKDIFYFAEDTGQLLLDGVSYSEATDLTPYAKAINLPDSVISNADVSSDANSVTLKYTKDSLIDGSNSEVNLQIPAATTSAAGVMSAPDKRKLDSLVKYQAGNGIDITGDTISCTLDTSLYSIVTELPTNDIDKDKIYLVSSTKTDNENRFSEYIYTDNGWEKLGEFKADVDLSNYVQKTDVVTDTTNGLMLASDKQKVDYLPEYIVGHTNSSGRHDIFKPTRDSYMIYVMYDCKKIGSNDEITSGFWLQQADQVKAGLMSSFDKTKLDSLENYILPAATTTTLGGVKVPTNIFTGSKNFKNHIRINNGEVGANFELIYNKSNKRINFIINTTSGGGVIDSDILSIDCTQFIKDGPEASITENGLMSKEDKAKLDSQPTIKANDATGVTDNDYVVIKKSEYQSILDRLSALEGS